jgi:hypothetical protein
MLVSAPERSAGLAARLADPATWDGLVDRVPWASPQHRSAWGTATAETVPGVSVDYVVFERDGQVVAGMPFMRLRVAGVFTALHSSLFGSGGGPILLGEVEDDDALWALIFATIDERARRARAFETLVTLPPSAPQAVRERFRRRSDGEAADRNCPVLRLDGTIETIVASFDSGVRKAIRRSGGQGVEVVVAADEDLLARSYAIYRDTMTRLGGSAKPLALLRKLAAAGLAVPFVAVKDGEPIALVILLVTRHVAIYWISCSTPESSTLRPTNALIDAAIRWSHEQGIGQFSFGESPGERSSLERFKLGWGSRIEHTTSWSRIDRPATERVWRRVEPVLRSAHRLLKRLV